MTGKEIIRREIERRMNCYKTEKTEENIGHRDKLLLGARIAQCEELLSFIDSMEEEPVSKVWHDAWKEEPEKGRNILVKDANTNCCFVSSFEGRKSWEDTYQGYAFRLWAYIDDLLKI